MRKPSRDFPKYVPALFENVPKGRRAKALPCRAAAKRETAEIKEELNSKAKEIEELEKENLRLSKANHSILHKQKSLE